MVKRENSSDTGPWAVAIVLVAIIAAIAVVTTSAIREFGNADDAIDFWRSSSLFVGVASGALTTFIWAERRHHKMRRALETAEADAKAAYQRRALDLQAMVKLAGHLDSEVWRDVLDDPDIIKALDTRC